MKHIKTFEDIDAFIENGGTEDEYLESPDYFVETYYNGQYGQLGDMLAKIREHGTMKDVIQYMDETMPIEDISDLKNWMLEN